MEEMSYLLLFTFFHSLICTLVAARISQFLTAAKKFSCCFSNIITINDDVHLGSYN